MKTTSEIRRENLLITKNMAGGTLELLAEMAGINASYLSQINNQAIDPKTGTPRSMGAQTARKIEQGLNLPEGWMDVQHTFDNTPNAIRTDFVVEIASNEDDYLEIPYYYAKASCGGGVVNPEDTVKGHLRKERSWFREYDVDAKNLVTVYADGDSMANYIEHGDMVIFDTSKTTPEDGEIFLITHVDSERIKKLRREINGNWVLESLNIDKHRFPDERITPEKTEYLKIIGRFVYRQGGKSKRR